MGSLIVIEGLDGSGKATQAAALADSCRESGRKTLCISFPNYKEESSALVRLYLSGALGDAGGVNAYAASSFYAADRYISYCLHWKEAHDAGHTIIADRYSTSNAVHQMSKLPKSEWDDFLRWMEHYEYVLLGLPRPDIVIYLDMHPETSRILLEKRYGADGISRDIHERDMDYLLGCREAALYACGRLGWRTVRCCDGRQPLPVMQIFERVKLLTQDI